MEYHLFIANEDGSENILGEMQVYHIKLENNHLVSYLNSQPRRMNRYDKGFDYGAENETKQGTTPLGKIFVEHLFSKAKAIYYSIGTQLTQVVIEESFCHGYGGRVMRTPGYNSPGFHYKMGFRYNKNQDFDKKVKEEIDQAEKEGRAPNTRRFTCGEMYLPKAGILKS